MLLVPCSIIKPIKHKSDLLSWNETELITKMINFVKKVSDSLSFDFVEPKDGIYVFNSDGTLWNGQPLHIPVEYEN